MHSIRGHVCGLGSDAAAVARSGILGMDERMVRVVGS